MASQGDRTSLANVDLQAALDRLTSSYDGRRAARAYGAVAQALEAIDRNASPKVVADWLVLQL
jgi:hypothetical protein